MAEEKVGTGRRKTSVASVRVRPGSGNITVNGRKFEEYFTLPLQRDTVLAPLKKFSNPDKYDLVVRLKGGGVEAQVIAARLGLARALLKDDASLKGSLKSVGFLTRDSRKKERKKYGLRGARKRSQFSKR